MVSGGMSAVYAFLPVLLDPESGTHASLKTFASSEAHYHGGIDSDDCRGGQHSAPVLQWRHVTSAAGRNACVT